MGRHVVCFGEVLWDLLPTGRLAGGAPMNVALRLQSLGITASLISRIGADAAGADLQALMAQRAVNTEHLQTDAKIATGVVQVQLDAEGGARYDIVHPAAWDRIALTEAAQIAVRGSDAFVFGSLAQRDPVSARTLDALLALAPQAVFDVNLRPPHYAPAEILDLMRRAAVIKLNHEELEDLCAHAGIAGDCAERLQALAAFSGAHTVCVTKGGDGAELWRHGRHYRHPGYPVTVVDTVGAGDSFLAALLAGLLQEADPQDALESACAVGAAVAGQAGANPELSPAMIAAVREGSVGQKPSGDGEAIGTGPG